MGTHINIHTKKIFQNSNAIFTYGFGMNLEFVQAVMAEKIFPIPSHRLL